MLRLTVARSAFFSRGFATSAAVRASKVFPSAAAAVEGVKTGDTVLAGGFGLCGVPNTLINALAQRTEVKGLTGVSNNAGAIIDGETRGLGKLLETKQLSRLICSYIGT